MRISFYSFILNLLLGSSVISANPLNLLSRRDQKNLVEPSRMRVDCNGRIYPSYELDTAAKEVCSRVSEETHCRDFMTCYYIKKAIPAIPSVSRYAGNLFDEYQNGGSLLRWPLPKRSYFERTRYHAIIFLHQGTRKCQAVGAIIELNGQENERCNEKAHGSVRGPIEEDPSSSSIS